MSPEKGLTCTAVARQPREGSIAIGQTNVYI